MSSFKKIKIVSIIFLVFVLGTSILFMPKPVQAQEIALCGMPENSLTGAYITVNSDQAQVNVRSGPNSYQYGKVGILFTYESAPAIGRSPGGDWIQISCPGIAGGTGWVYAANVTLTTQTELPIIEIPATSTPIMSATVDPLLSAEFPAIQSTSTRLPTFTPAAVTSTLNFEEYPIQKNRNLNGGFIASALSLGILIYFLSFILKR